MERAAFFDHDARMMRDRFGAFVTVLAGCLAVIACSHDQSSAPAGGASSGGASSGADAGAGSPEGGSSGAVSSSSSSGAATTGSATWDTNSVGASFAPSDALAIVETQEKAPDTFVTRLEIDATDGVGMCAAYRASTRELGALGFHIQVQRTGATAEAAAFVAGTYPLLTVDAPESNFEGRLIREQGGECGFAVTTTFVATGDPDTKNRLVLTTVTSERVVGTFEVEAYNQHARGAFDVARCDLGGASGPPVCE